MEAKPETKYPGSETVYSSHYYVNASVPEETFWTWLKQERISWLDLIVAAVVLSIPAILLAIIPW